MSDPASEMCRQFYAPLPEAVGMLSTLFARQELTQEQAAVVAACALNQMSNTDGQFPRHVRIHLEPSLVQEGR